MRTLPVALAVSLLTAGCAGGVSAPSPETPSSDATASAVAEPVTLMPVGPLLVPAANFWALGESSEGISKVRVGGCTGESTCPAFAIVTGTEATEIESNEAYLHDGINCPGGDDMVAVSATAMSEDPAVVAGVKGTLATFEVTCTGPDDQEQTVVQKQWTVQSPSSTVVVVDRWAFANLGERLAEAQWATVDTK